MPMYDYYCDECGELFEGLYRPEERTVVCRKCKAKGAIRVLLKPSTFRVANPLRMTVHRDPVTGQYRFPGRRDAPPPPGFEAVEITNTAQARKIEREVERIEQMKADEVRVNAQNHYDRVRAEGEDELKRILAGGSWTDNEGNVRHGFSTPEARKLAAVAMEQNRKRAATRSSKAPAPNAGFEALNYNLSNREGHADKDTDWKTVRE